MLIFYLTRGSQYESNFCIANNIRRLYKNAQTNPETFATIRSF